MTAILIIVYWLALLIGSIFLFTWKSQKIRKRNEISIHAHPNEIVSPDKRKEENKEKEE